MDTRLRYQEEDQRAEPCFQSGGRPTLLTVSADWRHALAFSEEKSCQRWWSTSTTTQVMREFVFWPSNNTSTCVGLGKIACVCCHRSDAPSPSSAASPPPPISTPKSPIVRPSMCPHCHRLLEAYYYVLSLMLQPLPHERMALARLEEVRPPRCAFPVALMIPCVLPPSEASLHTTSA